MSTLTSRAPGTVGMTARYALMSTRNVYRNVRFLVLTVALPLLLFLLYVNLYKGEDTGNGISVVAYLMVSMASFGCIGAAINTGARIAVDFVARLRGSQIRFDSIDELLVQMKADVDGARFPHGHLGGGAPEMDRGGAAGGLAQRSLPRVGRDRAGAVGGREIGGQVLARPHVDVSDRPLERVPLGRRGIRSGLRRR